MGSFLVETIAFPCRILSLMSGSELTSKGCSGLSSSPSAEATAAADGGSCSRSLSRLLSRAPSAEVRPLGDDAGAAASSWDDRALWARDSSASCAARVWLSEVSFSGIRYTKMQLSPEAVISCLKSGVMKQLVTTSLCPAGTTKQVGVM